MLSLQGFAQPTLNSAEAYQIGNERQYISGYPDSIVTIQKGANVNWDFNNIGKQDSFMQKILLPDSVDNGDQFPDADLVEWYGNGNQVFHDKGQQGNDYVGLKSFQDITIEFIRPIRILERPFTFNDQYFDTGRRAYTFNGFDVKGTGISRTQAIAYGKLKLPDTSYGNTVLVRNYQDWRDTVDVPLVTPVIKNQVISYAWFTPNRSYPVMRFDTIQLYSDSDQIPEDANDTIERLRYYKPLLDQDDTMISHQSKRVIAKNKNIVQQGNQLLIQGDFRQKIGLHLTLLNINGQPVNSRRIIFHKGWNQKAVSLKNSSKGFYILQGRNPQTGKTVLKQKILVH